MLRMVGTVVVVRPRMGGVVWAVGKTEWVGRMEVVGMEGGGTMRCRRRVWIRQGMGGWKLGM